MLGCGRNDAADYREKGNELCREALQRARDIPLPRSPDGVADYLEQIVETTSEYDDDFAALDPPQELEELHREAVRQNERAEPIFRRVIRRIRDAPDQLAALRREFRRLAPFIDENERTLKKLGLDECGETGLPGGDQPAPS